MKRQCKKMKVIQNKISQVITPSGNHSVCCCGCCCCCCCCGRRLCRRHRRRRHRRRRCLLLFVVCCLLFVVCCFRVSNACKSEVPCACTSEAFCACTSECSPYTALVPGSPATVHLESNCQEWSPGRGSVRISYVFCRSISKVLHVDLLLVGVQFSKSTYFC